ncbi:hypothetical protein C2E21_7472 [Chlorella sorokiniana]|uniref:Uncharacterized protein n=1 Tax=Chlorella sorokiniana TaxID=3076 RepID=A0A2P6THK1_CHLSO|nr:hypothetical protein C2E21_7472 [Chlorella sorokiniana]|eukprot:PRW33759.1 hypothetical protein C2E21_7472 [Chlorella sorokiniana]
MATSRPTAPLDAAGRPGSSPAAQSIRSLTQLLEDDWHTPLGTVMTGRPGTLRGSLAPPTAGAPTVQQAARGAEAHLQGLLAAKDSEAALLRQQLQQLTADFKFNLKLLEERDAELERLEKELANQREADAAHNTGLAEARRLAAEREAALREKEARVLALEERQKQLVELCERQVSEARAARDEEAARCCQEVAAAASDAARQKAEIIAGYERQVTAATAAEREARQRATALAEENEHVRSSLQRAEARVAEQELAMQRMVAQFEGALATLQQLEAQYDSLAADAGAADRLRAARIAELEAEVEGLRASRAGLQQERDGAVARLEAAAAAAEAEATQAKQQYHCAMMDAAELTEALSAARSEAHQQRQRAETAEAAAAVARASAAAAQQAAERESSAHARTQGLLEAARLHHEAARRDGAEQEALAAQLREAAAVLEAERNDLAKVAEAAEAKVRAAEERAALLAEQVEQEGALRAQLLEEREAELTARWEHALEAAQGERATLQQALDLANRQLAAAHRDMETLRLQVQHLRLGGGSAPAAPYAGSTHSDGGSGYGGGRKLAGAADSIADEDGSVQETASLAGSRDVFVDLHEPLQHHQQHVASPQRGYGDRQQQQQQQQQQQGSRGGGSTTAGPSAAPAASAYQQQLHQHIDTLASKLSNFQRAVEEARQVGQQASQQLAESRSMLPAELQRRQAAVADAQLQAVPAAERQQFEAERQRLDRQLAEQQRLLAEREAELRRMQQAEEEAQRREEEEQRRRLQQQEQQEREWEQQRRRREAGLAAAAVPPSLLGAGGYQSFQPSSQASPAAGSSLGQLPGGRPVTASSYSQQRRSVLEAKAYLRQVAEMGGKAAGTGSS